MQLKRPRASRVLGFTLVELMVVLLLIGIMASLALPEMKGSFEDALLRATARKLVAACRLASSQAISLQQAHAVRIDVGNQKYSVVPLGRALKGDTGADSPRRTELAGAQGTLDSRIAVSFHSGQAPAPLESEPQVSQAPKEFTDPPPDAAAPSESRRETLTFHVDGTAEGREIRLKDRAGFQLVLRIDPVTSRVAILERNRE